MKPQCASVHIPTGRRCEYREGHTLDHAADDWQWIDIGPPSPLEPQETEVPAPAIDPSDPTTWPKSGVAGLMRFAALYGGRPRTPDSPRWCSQCQSWGSHHTDRCPRQA